MKITKRKLMNCVIGYVSSGFIAALMLIWLDEVLDLPHRFFNAPATPINWTECIIESIMVLVLAFFVIIQLIHFLKKLKYLEGFLPVCAFCKRIRVGDKWIPIEEYIHNHSEVFFTHSYCPECSEKHYADIIKDE